MLFILVMACCGCSKGENDKEAVVEAMKVVAQQQFEAEIGDSVPVTRALVAKMLTMALYDLQSINATDREITFSDTDKQKWFDKYINAAYVHGIMQGNGSEFMPNSPITLSQAQLLLDKLDKKNKIKVQITNETKDKPISYDLWIKFYVQLLENMSSGKNIKESFSIERRKFIVLATPDNNTMLKNYDMITDKGAATFYGLKMKNYIDKEIEVLQKDGDVLAVLSVTNEMPTIKNAFVVNKGEAHITIFSGGAERSYKYANSIPNGQGEICDVKIDKGNCIDVTFYSEKINDVINKVSYGEVELKEKGIMVMDNEVKIYSTADKAVKWRQINNLLVGTDASDFFIKDGKVVAAIIVKNVYPEKIRVVLNTTNFKSLIHSTVSVSATRDFTISSNSNQIKYKAWEPVTITDEMFSENNRLYVATEPEGKIVLTSIKRNWPNNESPKYYGTIEISKDDGGYVVVNEVNFEKYLMAVVPSEMYTSFGTEAAKVQAITARSYAYNQYLTNRFYKYGANVDDSVNSQVYNNIPENETSIAAVNETKGQFLAYKGNIVSANFFSTSSGKTANSGEVWANSETKEFPTFSSEYLRSVWQTVAENPQQLYGDLKVEENAAKFFKDVNIKAFDSSFPWFRWNVAMTADEITASVNSNLGARYAAAPHLIKTLQEDGVFRSKNIDSIGELVDVEIKSRGEGGNIMEMIIKGTSATISVSAEYNVRTLISPVQKVSGKSSIAVKLKDGNEVENYVIMPSAFYTFDKSYDESGKIKSITFYGGGNGHGVGMSQSGVKGMLDLGYNVSQILNHYYPETEIIRLP